MIGYSARMSIVSNGILAFSMSADAFAASLGKGAALKRTHVLYALRVGLLFGVIEMLTPLIGWALGTIASRYIEAVDHWVAFTILGAIGAKMVYEGLSQGEDACEARESHKLHVLILTAIGTSIDSMAVGVTLALVQVNIWLMALAIGAATFLMTTIGIMAGHYIGTRAGRWAELVGGICLITIGSHILLQHMGVLG